MDLIDLKPSPARPKKAMEYHSVVVGLAKVLSHPVTSHCRVSEKVSRCYSLLNGSKSFTKGLSKRVLVE